MPTTFANSINNNLIYADRAEHDAAGNDIATTYATKQEIPSVPVTDVEVDGVSVVSSGVASITMPTFTQAQANWNESDTSAASYIQNKPSIPSGTQLVPAATSADADKVLTVDSQGTPAWASAQAPISAGNGIDITNNVVSVDTSVVATQTDLADKEDVFNVGTGLEMDTSGATPTLQVEAPVDIVAGPGIVIDNPDGNTLRVSQAYPTDETVLYDVGTGTSTNSITLSEPYTNFERIRVVASFGGGSLIETVVNTNMTGSVFGMMDCDNNGTYAWFRNARCNISSQSLSVAYESQIRFAASSYTTQAAALTFYKVIGIHRIASN